MATQKRKNANNNGQDINQDEQKISHPKRYKYEIINGKKIGKGWLESTQDAPMTVQNYRSFLLASLDSARNKYLDRMKIQNQVPNPILTKPINKSQNLKTVDPEIPNFSSKRNQMYKFAGTCIKSRYSRYFTVDSDNFKYYVGEKDVQLKKALELKDAQAFMQEKSEFMNKGSGKTDEKNNNEEWAEPNSKYRVGIQLKGRKMKSIFYYTQSLYEAKFLLVNIQLYGNQYKAATMANSINLSYLIEKASRFQKIARLMCLTKEKRFVSMHGFQQISVDLIDISQQALEFGRDLALKWFISMLDEDDKPIIRSAFRSANPRQVKKSQLKESQINKLVQMLSKFVQNRKMNRQQIISQEINRQIYEETTGITISSISMNTLKQNKYENILQIDNQQASLIFDQEDCYKYMIIENKTLFPSQSKNQINQRMNQAQNLIKKIDIGQISCISTDLDQTTQFDFNNKLNKSTHYKIRLYGPITRLGDQIDKGEQIAPCQIGLDYTRLKNKQFKISITKIKFPAELAKKDNEKITFYVKINQFSNAKDMESLSFDTTSQCIKIKGNNNGIVYPNDQQQGRNSAVFNVSKISNLDDEYFSIGFIIRKNDKPIYQCTERFLEQEELQSHDVRKIFNYKKLNTEQIVQLQDRQGKQFEVTFLVENVDSNAQQVESQEKTGRRLLVGRYAFHQGRVNYVRGLNSNRTVDIVDTFSKKERKVQIQNLQLIENHGVSIYKLDQEPNFVQTSLYDWVIDLKVKDKRILNIIHSKIQIRQAHLAYADQDTKIDEQLSSIEGDMIVSLMEIKGLIARDEINRRQINQNQNFDFFVELRLENFKSKIFKNEKCQTVKNKREINWQQQSTGKNDKEPTFIFQNIKHSKSLPESEIQLEKSNVRKTLKKKKQKEIDEDKQFLHFIVRNEVNGQEIGAAKIELDELIDVNLNDLAKEYCVCLNRSHILEEMLDKQTKTGTENEKALKQLSMFTLYSGIIRFQTLFQPTKDTCLRFVKLRDTTSFKSAYQLLHFENLLQKSDIDQYKFKIPQINYNPNIKNLGENYIDLQNLIQQSAGNQVVQNMLKKLQTKSEQVKALQGFDNQKINEQLLKQIDQKLKFQSPFEQINIILKLQRKERPFIEPIFFKFKNIWDIYKQLVKNQAFDSLNLNEWLSFIDELSGKHNFNKLDDLMEQAFDEDSNDLDKSDALTQKSFVGDMVKQMHSKAADFSRKSEMLAQQLEQNQNSDQKNFSLVLCKEWQKEGNQSFIDLVNLIKCGIPQMLRIVVWSDLMKTNLIAIEEKKTMIKNYPNKYNKQVSVFQNFVEISQKYDCVAFRQIDQDISDFRFPAFYYDNEENEGVKQAGITDMNLVQAKINRANKLKQDKQKMRKLLRILLVWGKTFKYKGVSYQFCYPTGFLKFAHRLINLMSIEEAFWIVIGMVRQYPRLWCLQESALLDDAKSIFRFEHTVVRAILEADFPEVTKKFYDLGLPVEVLIYDSITSLYCDQFHSDTLLRIWDQLIFYFNTTDQTSRRRGIWLILAPALLIIQQKQEQILRSQTIKEVIQNYNDGCGINYNPNHIIQLLNDLIDDVFVTEGKQTNKLLQNASNFSLIESGGTGSGNVVQNNKPLATQKQNSGFLSGIFSVFGGNNNIDQAPLKIDLIRRKFQGMQNLIFDNQRFKNKIVSEFLFDLKDSKQKSQAPIKQPNTDKKEDDMEFEGDVKYKKDQFQQKPNSHQYLDYRRWRTVILSKLNSQFLKAEEILDDDLHEFDDKDIYNKQTLDISQIHIYLHNLENWYGSASQQSSEFKIQVQYGKLNSNGNFEIKSQTRDDQSSIKNDQNLQYFCTFEYKNGYNFFKVRVLTADSSQNVCFCYGDLRGLQRGKIIQIQKFMNTKEYSQNAESQFSLTQIKMSLFINPKKEEDKNRLNNSKQQDQQFIFNSYLSSIKKLETNYINIYNPQKEKAFQKVLFPSLQTSTEFDNQSFSKFLNQDLVNEILNNKYKFVNVAPFGKYGNLSQQLFKEFLMQCLPEHYSSINFTDLNQLYKDFLIGKQSQNLKQLENQTNDIFDTTNKIESRQIIVDTEKIVNDQQSQNQVSQQNEKYFSLRSFVFSVLFQSPITVNEKLDILYDISDMGNRNSDGIDIDEAQLIYQTILQQHQYFLPFNELRTSVESAFNLGEVAGIVGAYWTSKMVSEIRFDLKNDNFSVTKLEEFINQTNGMFGTQSQVVNNQPVIELTSEIQNTFQMYQNLFGNKTLDFNFDTSPFRHINNLLAGTGKSDLGETLLQKTQQLGDSVSKKYRICLVSVVQNGERIVTEINYNLQTGIINNDEAIQSLIKKESQSFQKFFIRNQNILDLSGKQQALEKSKFLQISRKIPFVCDLLRAETIWQDRKLDSSSLQEKNVYGSQSQIKISSMRMKKRFQPVVNIFLSDKEKIFIFKFENKVMGGKSDQTSIKELVPKQIYLFELEALYLEDIILDMRDRITKEIQKIIEKGLQLSDSFVSEIDGKMEFYVRKIIAEEVEQGKAGKQKVQNLKWNWKSVNDFDRIQKFSDDEVFEDEVIFKLIKSQTENEELLDEKSQAFIDGYDCFSIYKHSDNSYEWRLCKIVGKQMRPEYKNLSMEAFEDIYRKKKTGKSDVEDNLLQGRKMNEIDQFYYFLEFYHLREQGKEMWIKRRREDVIFSQRYSRDQLSFEQNCFKFIMDKYKY